jgi:uncharacterized protein GlcG (DUF336 family)/DNA-binding winged helix-turn-helix (wHTH) protein
MDARCFAFGPFVLIPRRQVLLKSGIPARLGSRALEILTRLVQRPGEVIDKLELIALVWGEVFVDESNLKVNIAAIRRVIDCEATHGSCIATVVGRGYRFVEPVRELSLRAWDRSYLECLAHGCSESSIGSDRMISQIKELAHMRRPVTIVRWPELRKTPSAGAAAGNVGERYRAREWLTRRNPLAQEAYAPSNHSVSMEDKMPRQYSTLTLAEAKQILAGAEAKAESLGIAYNIAVVDAGGHLLAFSRQDGALIGSIDLAIDKASTARIFDKATSNLATLAQPGSPLFGIQESNDGKVVIFGGGIPIALGGEIIGAVGASAGTVEQDIAVAEAGVAALSRAATRSNESYVLGLLRLPRLSLPLAK